MAIAIGTEVGVLCVGPKTYRLAERGERGEVLNGVVTTIRCSDRGEYALIEAVHVEMVPQTIATEDFEREPVSPGRDGKPRLDNTGKPALGRVKRGQKIKFKYEPMLDAEGKQIVRERERTATLRVPLTTLEAILGGSVAGKTSKPAKNESTEVPAPS